MIKSYREWRLANICVMSIGVYSAVYMIVGLSTWGSGSNGYGVLPSFALSTDVNNSHTFVSLLYFVLATLLEGVVLAHFLDTVREIKREFSMLPELRLFTGIWVTLTDVVLFLVIQGLKSNWFTEITYYRIVFWILLLRNVLIVGISSVKPLAETYRSNDENAAHFIPIPATRECIESVDMVLHIPVAVDYFYSYLQSRHEQLNDK